MFEEVRESIDDDSLDEEDFKEAIEDAERRALEYYRSNCCYWNVQGYGGTTNSEDSIRQSIAGKKSQYISKHEKVLSSLYRGSVYPSSLTSNPLAIVELKIGNNSYNYSSVTKLILSGWIRLKRIVIGDKCFGEVRVFELDGLRELESVVIGKESFNTSDRGRSDGTCRIVNCPKLIFVQTGFQSFSDYHSFEMSNLPSLQSIDIGSDCFFWAPSFSLTGLID